MKNDKMTYFDGFRGLLTMIVFMGHFFVAFCLPLVADSTFFSIINKTPLVIFYNGFYSITAFYILSGYLISWQFFLKKDDMYLVSAFLRRYIRLTVPVLAVCLIVYAVQKTGLFSHKEIALKISSWWLDSFCFVYKPGIIATVKYALYNVYFGFTSFPAYNNVLWTMQYELIGSMLTLVILFITGKIKNRLWIYILLAGLFCNSHNIGFVFGIILADLNFHKPEIRLLNSRYILAVLFIFSVLLGTIGTRKPEIAIVNNILFHSTVSGIFATEKVLNYNISFFYMYVSSAVIILILTRSALMQKVFNLRILQFIGRVSYSFYLIHVVILCSFSSFIILQLMKTTMSYKLICLFTLVGTIAFALLISWVLYILVESRSIRWSRKFSGYFMK